MGLLSEMQNGYLDANGLAEPIEGSPSNNGLSYTGEYIYLLKVNNELTPELGASLLKSIQACIYPAGLVHRNSDGSGGQESIDDVLGLMLGAKVLNQAGINNTIGRDWLLYGLKHFGFYTNDTNSSLGSRWLWRFFMSDIGVAFNAMSSVPWYLKPVSGFFNCFTALSIFISCRSKDSISLDDYRLSWAVVKTMQDSWVCRLVTTGWYERLETTFGVTGMKQVDSDYFGDMHPFVKYQEPCA